MRKGDQRWRWYGPALFSVIAIAIIVTIWPYPKVEVVGEATMIGPTTVAPGATITWERESVCYPKGTTEVRREAFRQDRDFNPNLQIVYPLDSFKIIVSEPFCSSPSITPLVLPAEITEGTWIIEVTTDTVNPSYLPAESTSFSPVFTVKSDKEK